MADDMKTAIDAFYIKRMEDVRGILGEARKLKEERKDYRSEILRAKELLDVPVWRFAELLAEGGLYEDAGEVAEKSGCYLQASRHYRQADDRIGEERCLKKDASIRQLAMITNGFNDYKQI